MDFATRAYDHSYRIDPIVRSLLDTDFYKLLMCQFVWQRHPNTQVEWAVTNRTKTVKLGEEIDLRELEAQLDYVRDLRFTDSELIWLRGQTFYGQEGIFKPAFIDALRTLKLPDYELALEPASDLTTEEADAANFGAPYRSTGQITLTFKGPWWQSTLWEIYALAIVNEMRNRTILKTLSRSELDITYARAKVKLYEKLEKLKGLDGLNLTDFGTRRRHSFLWQEHCVLTAAEVLGGKFTGTSNVYLAMKHGFEPKGTNAHELPMVFAALENNNGDEAIRQSQYEVLKQWQNTYQGNLLVFLPDTFGTTQFLKDAPQWVSNWTGARPDSKDPYEAADELIEYWKHAGLTDEEVKDKLVLFSDGLDVDLIIALQEKYAEKIRVGFGWGTNLTNDFRDTVPNQPNALDPISLVCKVKSADGKNAVKLSDNFEKATGAPLTVEQYKKIFGEANMADLKVEV